EPGRRQPGHAARTVRCDHRTPPAPRRLCPACATATPAAARPCLSTLAPVRDSRRSVPAGHHRRVDLTYPQSVLTEFELNRLRARRSEKWRTYPDDVLPLFVAETDTPLAAPIRAALPEAIDLAD